MIWQVSLFVKMVTAEWSHSGIDLEISIKPKRLDYTNVPNQIQKDQIIQMCQIIEHFGWISANIAEGVLQQKVQVFIACRPHHLQIMTYHWNLFQHQ